MLTLTGLALAEAGPTAAPTVTVLMASAATMATRARVNCDCDDIGFSFLWAVRWLAARCPLLIKERANPGKPRKNAPNVAMWEISPTKSWWDLPRIGRELHRARRVGQQWLFGEDEVMLGKLAGAWIGEKIAGRNQGAKGAILGYGAAALARRSVPLLAGVALGGWAFRKWRERRRARPSYPSDAAPQAPASETRSPS